MNIFSVFCAIGNRVVTDGTRFGSLPVLLILSLLLKSDGQQNNKSSMGL